MRVAPHAFLVAVTAVGTAVGAPLTKDSRKPTDPPGGDWVVQNHEHNGRKSGPSERVIGFTSKKWVVLDGGYEERADYYKNGDAYEIDLPDSYKKGIWKVDGDTLRICLGAPGADRPIEFSAPEGSRRILWTLTRKKKD